VQEEQRKPKSVLSWRLHQQQFIHPRELSQG